MSRAARGVDVEDLLVRVKNGTESELADAAREVSALAEEGNLGGEEDGLLVPALLARLAASGTAEARVSVMAALRRLAGCVRADTKVSAVRRSSNRGLASGALFTTAPAAACARSVFHDMLLVRRLKFAPLQERLASIDALSSIVRSLSRDVDETREAVAVLLALTDIPQVRQRIGRIKGCIVMLVTLRNAHESGADVLLHILASSPQNVLLMAEAGYFRPLIHYLRQGIMSCCTVLTVQLHIFWLCVK
jgi:vacuolar protein 8